MMKFYYDESEHSRKINESTMGELKSTTLKLRQFQWGVASLTRDNLDFVNDFFDIFDDKIEVYFSVNSKIEYIINQLFQQYENNLFQDADALRYSIVKTIVLYQPESVINGIYNETENIIEIIKQFYKARIEANKRNPALKRKETAAYQEAMSLFENINPDFHIEWDYHFSFQGFKKYLLKTKKSSVCSLFLDKEGQEQNTRNAAVDLGITSAEELDSKDSIGIRISDMFIGIVSKLLKSIHENLKYENFNDGVEKKYLSEGWFKINERQLEIYKKLAKIFESCEYSVGIYCDDVLILKSIVEYFSHFTSVEEVKKIDVKDHQKFLNAFCVDSLEKYYSFMHTKLPFEFLDETDLDYFIDRRGAKTYYDAMKQPLLDINQGTHKYYVLNVGLSKQGIPTIDIEENSVVNCYRLPEELTEWVITNIEFAMTGENLFPSEVVFSKIRGKYFVDFVVENNFNAPISRIGKKIGRNKPCPCGSGKKYKKCCSK